ncbi:hypothetical protein G6F53_014086 [Rhizopus delemar]|nr:hypothetical protein G6F53_014086 [Rhizopus delemar]
MLSRPAASGGVTGAVPPVPGVPVPGVPVPGVPVPGVPVPGVVPLPSPLPLPGDVLATLPMRPCRLLRPAACS